MDPSTQRPKGRDGVLSALNVAIEGLNLAKEISSVTPAKAVFGSVGILLAMVRDSMANRMDFVELGLACADVCKALDRGMDGRQANQFSRSVFEAIEQLSTTVTEIERNIVKLGKRNAISRLFRSQEDKDKIAAWRLDLNRILHVFNTELSINTNATVSDMRHDLADTRHIVSDIHRTMVERQEGSDSGNASTRSSTLGESPPPAPRACFGRDEIIEEIISLAENLEPVALIGAGGIGKTSIALTVLHHPRIKQRFSENRRFIRCDQFPATLTHFLSRLSKVIGAGAENLEDLTPLLPFLSSKEMLIVLDNAESILDPQGANSREIYTAVEELGRLGTISLCITSRISTVPPDCETLDVPTLSMEFARDAFYRIYKKRERSDVVDDVLKKLDFHPLSITLLATVAHQNKWNTERLIREWEGRRTGTLETDHQTSLATTIELSLASPLFKGLGSDALGLLGVAAFYPQGINENNLSWLFPALPDVTQIFDKFCVLSLTYRSNEFITMLAPLRDHLRPKDPKSSPLLCATKERYFARMSVTVDPKKPGFNDARWIVSEDVNVEHLLDFFTSADPDSNDIWKACISFLNHLQWHKPRKTVLRSKIEALPDDHPSKPECLYEVASLIGCVGNRREQIQLLTHLLKIRREQRDDGQVATTLRRLSIANRMLNHREEGIRQAKEALEIYERLGNTIQRARCLDLLARLLCEDGQLDAAEEAAIQSSKLFPEKGHEYGVCKSHRALGNIYRSKGDRDKAIHHYELALGIASSFNWRGLLFWIQFSLAQLFLNESEFDNAHAHIKQAESHAPDNPFNLGAAALLQARILYRRRSFEDATSEASRALEIFEKLGASNELGACRSLLQNIERTKKTGLISSEPNSSAQGDSPLF